jgi:hypothetical protein
MRLDRLRADPEPGADLVDSRLKFPDGSITSWEEGYALHPEIQFGYDDSSGITNVVLFIPGSRYHDVERREAIALVGLAAGFIAIAGITVARRRPR